MKPKTVEDRLDDILLDYLNNHEREAIAIEQIKQVYAQMFLEMLDSVDDERYHFPNTAVPSMNGIAGWKLDELRNLIKEKLG